jgi:hypothetical protein
MARGAGRDLKKEEFWRQRLGAQGGSGLSIRGWCRRHGVRESAFYWWRRELGRRDAEASAFAPVRVVLDAPSAGAESGAPGRIEIVLPGERRVHVIGHVERAMLADVLAVLTEGSGAPPADEGVSAVSRC